MERTELLMIKAVVRYREDWDLENAIDFIQKKVKDQGPGYFIMKVQAGTNCVNDSLCVDVCINSSSAVESNIIRTGPRTSTSSVQRPTPVWRPVEFLFPAAFHWRTRSHGHMVTWSHRVEVHFLQFLAKVHSFI